MPERKYMLPDELSCIIQFSPVALVILDRNRCLRRVNQLAENMLGINSNRCHGESFQSWVDEQSRVTVAKAMNHAAESKWTLSPANSWAVPSVHNVSLTQRKTASDPPGKPFWAQMSCTACYEDFTDPNSNANGYLHEAWYIVSLIPSVAISDGHSLDRVSYSAPHIAPAERETSCVTTAGALKDAIIYSLDLPVIALSNDGKTAVRNGAADRLLESLVSDAPRAEVDTGPRYAEGIELDWLFANFDCWTPDFSKRLPETEYSLYKVAIDGVKFRNLPFGVLGKKGQRKVIDSEGICLFDAEGEGNHIGGLILLRDITDTYDPAAPERVESLQQIGVQQSGHNALAVSTPYQAPTDPYQSLCQDLGEIAWIASANGSLEWYNSQWYEYTGMSVEESAGSGWTEAVHTEDIPSVSKAWSKSLRLGARYDVQERIRDRNGNYRWFLCRAHPFKDAVGKVTKWFGLLLDVDSTLGSLAANREARTNLSDAVRVADVTLWSVDKQGLFTLAEGSLAGPDAPGTERASSLCESSTGSEDQRVTDNLVHIRSFRQSAIIGKSIYSEWGNLREPIEKALRGELVVEETVINNRTYRTQFRATRARTSAPTSFLLSTEPEDENENIIGVTGLSFDITERLAIEKKFEESIHEVAKAEAASQAAKEASRMKSQFLAVISHEIRTPLNGVVGLSELLLDVEQLPAEAQELVHSILRSSGALLTVINDVLDFSKVEAGKLDLVSLPFSLKLVCEDSARDFQRLMNSKGLTLKKEIDLPDEMIMGDAGRITQVLNNVLSNAGKFTEKGDVTFSAHRSKTNDSSSEYVFRVTDSGCGIPEAARHLLFQPFRQADPSTSRRYGGSGLGLAICRNLIDLMGGQIHLDSTEGIGTTVTFTIPFDKPEAPPLRTPRDELAAMNFGQAADDPTTPRPPKEDEPLNPSDYLGFRRSSVVAMSVPVRPRVLLAEDNPVNSQIAIKTLAKLGYDTEHVVNGLEAVEAVKTLAMKNPYDIILMDCMMPEMSGFDAARIIRAMENPYSQTIPIIALTAAAISGRTLALQSGMSDFLSKPVRRATLDAMLTKWMGRSHVETVEYREAIEAQKAEAEAAEAAAATAAMGGTSPTSLVRRASLVSPTTV